MHRQLLILATALLIHLAVQPAYAQTPEKSIELGASVTGTFLREIGTTDHGTGTSASGVGGRLTYNFTRYIALDSEISLLPGNSATSGNRIQAQLGIKAGPRTDKFGVFAKVRPGFMYFRNDPFGRVAPGGNLLRRGSISSIEPMVDVGGVVEVYPSSAWIVRFDAGDTIIKFRKRLVRPTFDGPQVEAGGFTTHNFQGSIGVGFRF